MQKRKLIPIILTLFAMLMSACNISKGENNITNSLSDELSDPAQTTDATSAAESTPDISDSKSPADDDNVVSGTQSACYHPYFPITDGASWTYREASGEEYTLSVDLTSTDTFTLTQEFKDSEITLEMDWYCSDDGLLNGTFSQVDLITQMSGENDPEVTIETLEWEGATLPPAEMLVLGYQWITSYEMKGEMTIESLTTTTEVNVKIENTLGAIEEVSVEAGTFPKAYRVDSVGEIEMILIMGETVTPVSGFQFTYSTWYVEGVGMVKSNNEFSGMESVIELIDSSLLP